MTSRPRFGTAGNPIGYKGPTEEVPFFLIEKGLDAYEYQAVRGVRIKEEKARILGENAKKCDVLLSLHAPYYINLSSDKKTTYEQSKKRLFDALKAAHWMGARLVVFHPGYYGEKNPEEALKMCIDALKEVLENAEREGITDVLLGPETTGKTSQLGTLEEVINMCEEIPRTVPVIDWAHIHARNQGCIAGREDYEKILSLLEERLGSDVIKNLHCHFTHVAFSESGETEHKTLSDQEYGPKFEPFAEIIVDWELHPVIISESPVLEEDALKMKGIVESLIKARGKAKK
ncbi:MAG: TIM barrel protein [Candidatus Baldrarchaeia archaeon]